MMARATATMKLNERVRPTRARGVALRRAVFVIVFGWLLTFAPAALAATFVVNNSSNTGDSNIGNGVCRTSNGGIAICTLRAALQEANALGGIHTINFSIPTTDAGYSATRNVVVITVPTALPAIQVGVLLDGTTQPNTNTGALGVGGTVGVGAVSLSAVNIPDIEIVGTSAIAIGLDVQASNVTIRGVAIYGFGATANSDTNANIRINAGFTGTIIERNVLGSTANSFPANYSGAALSIGDNVRVVNSDNGTIRNNLIGFSAGKGIQLGGGSSGWAVTNNEVRGNGIGNSNLDGIDIENGSGGNTVSGNLFTGNEALGVDMYQSSGSNIIQNNTITRNGVGPSANAETAGIRVYGTSNSIDRNIITFNYGAGVLITSTSTLNVITRNSISANGTITNKNGVAASGEIGIDLNPVGSNDSIGTSPYVTPNDANDIDTGGNGLLNFPVLASATLSGTNLTLTGYARPNATLEFFIAAPDPRGFGEGQTYIVTLTEGSASDTDATTGTYTSPFNTLTVGTDTTNRFKFTIAVPGGVAVGTTLTATATLSGSTSEFSNNISVVLPPVLSLVKCVFNGPQCVDTVTDVLPGTDLLYSITFTNTGGSPASTFIVTDKIPTNTEFKVGSVVNNLGTTGLTVGVAYSNNNGTTWTYTPASGTGGAPAGYDRTVTHVRWSFGGSLSQSGAGNTGSVRFTVRIK
jgi:parallel beta-helix repeat protein